MQGSQTGFGKQDAGDQVSLVNFIESSGDVRRANCLLDTADGIILMLDVGLPAGELGLSPASRLVRWVPVPTADMPRVQATLSDSALLLSVAVTGNKVLVMDKGDIGPPGPLGATMWPRDPSLSFQEGLSGNSCSVWEQFVKVRASQTMFSRTRFHC